MDCHIQRVPDAVAAAGPTAAGCPAIWNPRPWFLVRFAVCGARALRNQRGQAAAARCPLPASGLLLRGGAPLSVGHRGSGGHAMAWRARSERAIVRAGGQQLSVLQFTQGRHTSTRPPRAEGASPGESGGSSGVRPRATARGDARQTRAALLDGGTSSSDVKSCPPQRRPQRAAAAETARRPSRCARDAEQQRDVPRCWAPSGGLEASLSHRLPPPPCRVNSPLSPLRYAPFLPPARAAGRGDVFDAG